MKAIIVDGTVNTTQSHSLETCFRSLSKNGIDRIAAKDVPGRNNMVHVAILTAVSHGLHLISQLSCRRLTVRIDRLSIFMDSDSLCALVARMRDTFVSSCDAFIIACIATPLATMMRSLLSCIRLKSCSTRA